MTNIREVLNNHQSQQPIIHPTHLGVPVIHEL